MVKRWVGQVVAFKDGTTGVIREAQIMDIGGKINLLVDVGNCNLYLTESELALNRE